MYMRKSNLKMRIKSNITEMPTVPEYVRYLKPYTVLGHNG